MNIASLSNLTNSSVIILLSLTPRRYASQEEIKRKYHHLAKIHHPDSGGDGEIFMHIQSAYAVLGDVDKRSAYNEEKREKETERIKVRFWAWKSVWE